jgi:tripartite-type tricarboxylate transporter receptor subunit TctC
LLAIPDAAHANEYPDRSVKIVVGFAPGGTNDIVARTIAIKLQERLKQPFVVENRPGANSAVGTDFVAKAKPDGYTLLVSSSGGLTVNPALVANLPYQPEKDFEPIALLGTFPLVVTAPATAPYNTLAEMVDFAKKSKGGELNHGVASSSFQLVAETLAGATGVKFTHVPYRGSGPTVTALMGGEIQVALLDSAAVMGQVKAGKLKALAVTTASRSGALPNLPTVSESGFKGYDAPIWTAFMAPKGTPEPVLQRLRAAMKDILTEKDMVEKLRGLGMDSGNTDTAALSKRISADIRRWTEIAKAAGIKAE